MKKIKILKVKYHRNGSGPCEGFFAVLFEEKTVAKEDKEATPQFIATFKTDGEDDKNIDLESIRVMNVGCFDSKWRGDYFVSPLWTALGAFCKKLKVTKVSWSAAAFPSMYQPESTFKH